MTDKTQQNLLYLLRSLVEAHKAHQPDPSFHLENLNNLIEAISSGEFTTRSKDDQLLSLVGLSAKYVGKGEVLWWFIPDYLHPEFVDDFSTILEQARKEIKALQ